MKNLFMAIMVAVSLPVFAQSVIVYPVVLNFGNSIEVQIDNTTDFNLSCSGTVMMNTQSGRSETAYYSEYISKNSFSFRMFYLMNNLDTVTSTNQFINCSKVE